MKMCGGDEVELHAYIHVIPALWGGEWSATPANLTADTDIHPTGSCAGPKADLEGAVKIKISTCVGNRTPVVHIANTLIFSFSLWKNFLMNMSSGRLNPDEDADCQSYFRFKYPRLPPGGQQHPFRPLIVSYI
jgi:hypothetical protein